jgi:hypothetical protein
VDAVRHLGAQQGEEGHGRANPNPLVNRGYHVL